MVCWSILANEPGCHEVMFEIGGHSASKQISIGEGYLPTSLRRPEWNWSDVLLHPREDPFPVGSPVTSIEVDFPERNSWTSGTNSWVVYWFVVSLVAAFAVRPILKVNI
jgi:hypothetical protein